MKAVSEVTDDLVQAVRRLLPQLSSSARPPTDEQVAEIVTSPATTLLVATWTGEGGDGAGAAEVGPEDGAIVGMLTLAVFLIPTGVRAWVEDVVVDQAVRGRGVGDALLRAAVELASQRGAQTLDLTSRPSREAANRLYLRAGFQLRETNVYRLSLGT